MIRLLRLKKAKDDLGKRFKVVLRKVEDALTKVMMVFKKVEDDLDEGYDGQDSLEDGLEVG